MENILYYVIFTKTGLSYPFIYKTNNNDEPQDEILIEYNNKNGGIPTEEIENISLIEKMTKDMYDIFIEMYTINLFI